MKNGILIQGQIACVHRYFNSLPKNAKSKRVHLFWRSDFNKAIRKGDWKLIINEYDNTNLLFNIKDDKAEKHNLYLLKHGVAEGLIKEIDNWEKDMVKPLWPRVVNYVYRDETGKYVFAL